MTKVCHKLRIYVKSNGFSTFNKLWIGQFTLLTDETFKKHLQMCQGKYLSWPIEVLLRQEFDIPQNIHIPRSRTLTERQTKTMEGTGFQKYSLLSTGDS